jgi:single-stranded-DNA-specific exonuclease
MKWVVKGRKKVEDIDEIKEILFSNRGIKDIPGFLNPPDTFTFLKNPRKIFGKFSKGLEETKNLIEVAIKDSSPIILHGDYDVDGISATAILWDLIYNHMGYRGCVPFIPDRFDHGYGLTEKSIRAIRDIGNFEDTKEGKRPLLITLDCGITAVEEVEYAKKLGFKVAIIDHHEVPKKLPEVEAVLHTTKLCSGGIAFMLSSYIKGENDSKNIDLAALSTIADLQLLLGINRSVVKDGLLYLTNARREGIKALKTVSGIAEKNIGVYEVGWILSPRLNASGRLAQGMDSLRLLCTKNPSQALEIAKKLNEINMERQSATEEIFNLVDNEVKAVIGKKLIISYGEGYHEGVIGLVAQRIVQKYFKPAIVIAKKENVSKASVRSVPGLDITEFLRKMDDILESVGGHKMAAGFSIKTEKIEEFVYRAERLAVDDIAEDLLVPFIEVDLEIGFKFDLNLIYDLVKNLEPFGLGNPHPVFAIRDATILSTTVFGKGNNHINISFLFMGNTYTAKIFDANTEICKKVGRDIKMDMCFSITKNFYNGNEYINLIAKDINFSF